MPLVRRPLFQRSVAVMLVASTTLLGFTGPARAAVIGTDAAVQATTSSASATAATSGHERLAAALARTDVVAVLESRGVDPDAARQRAAALTEAEAADLAQRIDQVPTGGISAVAAVALVFVVLVITDILGFTKVFSFTSAIK